MTMQARFKAERERLEMSQPKLGELLGVGKTTVINWEKGTSAPDAFQLATLASAGADVLYILTGEQPALPSHEPIDSSLFFRIADKLEDLATSRRKRWSERTKVEQVVKIYNYLAHDAGVVADDDKIERTLRLVVNQ